MENLCDVRHSAEAVEHNSILPGGRVQENCPAGEKQPQQRKSIEKDQFLSSGANDLIKITSQMATSSQVPDHTVCQSSPKPADIQLFFFCAF